MPQPSNKPIFVSADQISVRVRQIVGNQTPEVIAVRSEGNVQISQEGPVGEKPLELEGDLVKLDNQSLHHEIIEIFGKPAQIRDHRFRLEGKDIYLNRGENEAQVRGAGWMKIRIPDQAQIPGLEGTANRDLNVRWDESMKFDGLDARFVGGVEAKLGQASMLCEQMSVQLLERLSFQSDSIKQDPAIRLVHCRENVRFENSTRFEKKLVDKYIKLCRSQLVVRAHDREAAHKAPKKAATQGKNAQTNTWTKYQGLPPSLVIGPELKKRPNWLSQKKKRIPETSCRPKTVFSGCKSNCQYKA